MPSANKANFAAAAESANPVVFARVTEDGLVDSASSKASPSTAAACAAPQVEVRTWNPVTGIGVKAAFYVMLYQ